MDRITKEQRSSIMSRIRSKNTNPEIVVRKALWKNKLRYRLHDKSIPGTPDISIKSKKIVIFIDGCFWHGCPICYVAPKSNTKYWKKKMLYNQKRRKVVKEKLRKDNWTIMEFWECQVTSSLKKIVSTIQKTLVSIPQS